MVGRVSILSVHVVVGFRDGEGNGGKSGYRAFGVRCRPMIESSGSSSRQIREGQQCCGDGAAE